MGKKRKNEQGLGSSQEACQQLRLDPDALTWLLAPEGLQQFQTNYWEKRPLLVKGTGPKLTTFQGLSDVKELLSVIRKRAKNAEQPLEFGTDINAARYLNGIRETPNGEVVDEATIKQLFFEGGCTLQPQRYNDVLWKLLAAMEAQLGCLVGCNAYLTPKGTQGLAPHHDDVEIFVCQTAGSKRWRLYEPVSGYHLPSTSSGDLAQSQLGELIMEVELQVGDVLYLPRGTVHQAVAQAEDSAHVTISTYQRWALQDLLGEVVGVAMETHSEPCCMPLSLRAGLPLGCLFEATLMGQTGKGPSAGLQLTCSRMAAGLRELADRIEQHHSLTLAATHTLAPDFLRMRLPPHPSQLPPKGPAPTLQDSIACRGRGFHMILPLPAAACEDNPELAQGAVKLYTSLLNERERHMMLPPVMDGVESGSDEEDMDDEDMDEEGGEGDDDDQQEEGGSAPAGKHKNQAPQARPAAAAGKQRAPPPGAAGGVAGEGEEDLSGEEGGSSSEEGEGAEEFPGQDIPGVIFPMSFSQALAQVLASSHEAPLPVKQLAGLSEQQQVQLAFTLWAEGFVSTVPTSKQGASGAKQQGKRSKQEK